jgi:hypothetical protein
MQQRGPVAVPRPGVGRRVRLSRALGFALANVSAGFTAVALGTIGERADWAALLTAFAVPPLLAITGFHAMRDLGRDGETAHARVQAWLALLLSVAPLLLLVVFLMVAGPAGRGQTMRWLPWTRD